MKNPEITAKQWIKAVIFQLNCKAYRPGFEQEIFNVRNEFSTTSKFHLERSFTMNENLQCQRIPPGNSTKSVERDQRESNLQPIYILKRSALLSQSLRHYDSMLYRLRYPGTFSPTAVCWLWRLVSIKWNCLREKFLAWRFFSQLEKYTLYDLLTH